MHFYAFILSAIGIVLLNSRAVDAIAGNMESACRGPNNSDHHKNSPCSFYTIPPGEGNADAENGVIAKGTCQGNDNALTCIVEYKKPPPEPWLQKRMLRVRRREGSAID
ncbi:hypothetical protein EV361DRAFT_868252 [Lentinula raphanica]|nr:hypothetical protein EV361DRAFT_868252 [Lentinula raphanica]